MIEMGLRKFMPLVGAYFAGGSVMLIAGGYPETLVLFPLFLLGLSVLVQASFFLPKQKGGV